MRVDEYIQIAYQIAKCYLMRMQIFPLKVQINQQLHVRQFSYFQKYVTSFIVSLTSTTNIDYSTGTTVL